nr:RecQ family zinc-binding domain-containing protein [Deltaproteobacteria bacterium]
QVFSALEAFTDLHRQGGRLAEESPPNVANIALSSGVGQQRTRTVLSLLKDEKFITEKEGGIYFVAEPPPEPEELMERARQYEARRIADRQRLDALLAYVKAPGCRNQVILSYLGEPEPPKCGRCDNCLRSREAALAASTLATNLGASLTRQLDDDPTEVKPRREIKARVVRIDQPAPTTAPTETLTPAVQLAKPQTVLRRTPGAAAAQAKPNGHPAAPVAARPAPAAPAPAAAPPPVAAAPVPAPAVQKRKQPAPAEQAPQDDDEDDDDDDLDDDELELVDGEDDDDLDDDDDDDDDLDDDEDDDDDDDDDDYEVIDKTAAELAEEGIEGPGEITVLARKKVPKVPKQRPARVDDATSPSASAAEARRRRRRRRRKRRAMLPPKSAFTTPVLSTAAPIAEAQPRRGGGGGPVIEYVRGPMRIAMAPVASANPNDAGAGGNNRGPRRGKKTRRWERGGPGGFDRGQRDFRPRPDGGGGGPRPPQPPGAGPVGENGQPGERKRRRRRRRRGPGNGAPTGNGQQMLPPADGAPVSFFEVRGEANRPPPQPQPQQPQGGPPQLGPDGQPLRKRRRRRRRGRGGRQREWRAQNGGEGGGPPPEGGGDGGGGGGSMSDGDSGGGEG